MNSPTPAEATATEPGFAGDTSKDAFLGGAFHLLQPRRSGFRAGHDALLLAAAVPREAGGLALDMGSGAGAVAFASASRARGLSLILAERSPDMAHLARASLALPENRALADRLKVVEVDLLSPRPAREAAGLPDGGFDRILSNPPFHPAGGRVSPDALRGAAKSLPEPGFLGRWLAVAGALARHGAPLALIVRPDNLGEILQGAEGRFGAIALCPVQSSAEAPAIRLLVSAVRGSRAPLRILPALVLDEVLRGAISRGEVDLSVS
ncbi:tRNA1(Val) (adenine(37)-N6)-methyltransferase [Aureimonas sp. AU40]|uniref:tRNA1(Val) (adenine(37)-N6)-methyltransferase n=1 Tax=Aureimonas sp. AU40 TaxID=1637747 RepID=UPI000780865A|nr:methyltransferase [Aureimonas sp. AU40]